MKHYAMEFSKYWPKALFLVVFFFCTQPARSQNKPDSSQVKKQVALLNQQMEAAFNNNDMKAVAAFYADDGEIVYDNYTVRGRSNLDKYWSDLKDKGRGWKLTVVEIGGEGEFVYQLGTSDLKYIRNNKESRAVTNFVLLWKKQADGSYKIFRDYLTETKFQKD